MPYEWLSLPDEAPAMSGASAVSPPGTTLHLWQHQSLTPRGFVWFIGATCALLAVPLFAVLGSAALWGLLPFMVLAVGGVWLAIGRSWRDGELEERLTLRPDRAELVRNDRQGEQRWSENPYWVTVRLHETGGPVPNYVTLKGQGREVEIGAFLSEDERLSLRDELAVAFARLR